MLGLKCSIKWMVLYEVLAEVLEVITYTLAEKAGLNPININLIDILRFLV